MNVGHLTQFIANLAATLKTTDSGFTTGRDLEAAARELAPFTAYELPAFAEFLQRCGQYAQTGAVRTPQTPNTDILTQAIMAMAQPTAGKEALQQSQTTVGAELVTLAAQAGLKLTVKPDAKWLDQQLATRRVLEHRTALRQLAETIVDATSFTQVPVQEAIERLGKTIATADWKALAAEYGLPSSTKGASGVIAILAKLTGHQPVVVSSKKTAKPKVDDAQVATHANRLQQLLERAKNDANIPPADITAELTTLTKLSVAELVAIMTKLDLTLVGKTKPAILKRIESLLKTSQRIAEQTEQ